MDPARYFLPKAADEVELSAWAALVPASARVIHTNLFGDAFVVDELGTVHMLERGACSADEIASSEEEFWRKLQNDEDGWQLRPLADDCRQAGLLLGEGQCYAFKTLPILGGKYETPNIYVCGWSEWFSLTADVFRQIRDLPDGATVTLKVVD